jgi:Domain of unknown function (DUF5658)
MFAWSRLSCALSLAGALVAGGASPVLASDAAEQKAAPSINLSMAAGMPLVPLTEVSVPLAIPTDAAQTRPIDMAIPRSDAAGFGAPGLRRSLYVSFGALQVLDALSTRTALNAGAREANPAMAGIAKNTAALFAVKAGTAAATTYLAERLAKNHPRRAAILMTVLNTAYVGIVAHNYRVARARAR